MTLLKCATHVVSNLEAAQARFSQFFDYSVVEQGTLSAELAASWGAPASTGKSYVVMQPASGSPVLLRFVQGDTVEAYKPINSFGWGATEICVQDVEVVNERMINSGGIFEVIGKPAPLDGFPTVKPMQVISPDKEIIYLTEIKVDDPKSGLPNPRSLVDRIFIMVLACPDLRTTAKWFEDVFGFEVSAPIAIRYSMINKYFGLDADTKHELVTIKWNGQTIMEADQYPEATVVRPQNEGELVPGIAMVTIMYPDFARLEGHWVSQPVVREGALYAGKRVGVLRTPEGALIEVVEGDEIDA